MKSNIENLSNLERKISVHVPTEQVNTEFSNAFKYLQKSVEIKGFRKGKTPLETIRSLYGEKIKGDVAQNLVQQFFYKAIQEHDVIPIGMPDIDFQAPEENKDFSFTARFEVQPEITLTQTDGLQVDKEKFVLPENALNENIQLILENNSVLEDVILVREAKQGDFVDLDFTGSIDGKPLENGAAQGHVLEIGSNSFIPGFEEAVIGMKPGDNKTIQLSFPADYHVENLKGKPVKFDVKVNKIKQKISPELNDEFVKGMGEFSTVDEFKTRLKEDMENNEAKRIDQDLKNRLFRVLVKANPFEVPETLVKEQRTALVEDFKRRMQGQGINAQDFAAYEEKWHQDFSNTANFMVRSALLIQKIAKDNKLEATVKDVEAKLQEFADQTGLDLSKVKEFYRQGQQSANLEFQVTEDKVYKYLLEKAKVTEVEKDKLPKEEEEMANL